MARRLFFLLVSIAVWVADSFRQWVASLVGKTSPGTWVVLYYHSVPMEKATAFARQMERALRWATPVSPAAHRLPQGRRFFSVTFDDALQNLVGTALPLLLARGIPAAVFVPAGFVGRKASWKMEKGCGEQGQQVMKWSDLRSLEPELVVIGSHTMSHPHLTRLSDEELERELARSRLTLEARLGRPVRLVSFPHGDYDARVLQAARHAGYTRAFSVDPWCDTFQVESQVLGRVKVDPSDWPIEFFLKIRGAYRWRASASRLKQRLKSLKAARHLLSADGARPASSTVSTLFASTRR